MMLLLLLACKPDDGSQRTGDLTIVEQNVVADQGVALVEVEVGENDRSFLMTGLTEEYLGLEALTSPSGEQVLYWEDWYDSPYGLTNAFYFWGHDMSFNWPIRAEDPFEAGTWIVQLAALEVGNDGYLYYVPGAPIGVTTYLNVDGDLGAGVVPVRIVYARGVDEDAEVVAAVQAAVDHWKEIWSAFGLVLEESYESSDLDPDLPYVGDGSDDYRAVTAEGEGDSITLVMGETIDGQMDLFGTAGNIPGSLTPTERSAVTIAWLVNAGTDGQFSEDELSLFGETMAHETGHYMGLYHPVESTVDAWDALEDTADCSAVNACETALGDNLMFPYPICGFSSCRRQEVLTEDQTGVAQRYTGVQ